MLEYIIEYLTLDIYLNVAQLILVALVGMGIGYFNTWGWYKYKLNKQRPVGNQLEMEILDHKSWREPESPADHTFVKLVDTLITLRKAIFPHNLHSTRAYFEHYLAEVREICNTHFDQTQYEKPIRMKVFMKSDSPHDAMNYVATSIQMNDNIPQEVVYSIRNSTSNRRSECILDMTLSDAEYLWHNNEHISSIYKLNDDEWVRILYREDESTTSSAGTSRIINTDTRSYKFQIMDNLGKHWAKQMGIVNGDITDKFVWVRLTSMQYKNLMMEDERKEDLVYKVWTGKELIFERI